MLEVQGPVPRRKLGTQLAWFLLWLGTVAVAWYLQPSKAGHGTHQSLGLPPCPSVLTFGRPCPGCGLTTSFAHTVRGSFGEAFVAHPLGSALFLMFTAAAWLAAWGFATRRSVQLKKSCDPWILVVLLIFLGYGTFRFATRPDYGTPREQFMGRSLRR